MAAERLLAVGLLFAACSSDPEVAAEPVALASVVASDVATPTAASTTVLPSPTAVQATAAERVEATSVVRAPLGSFVVARGPFIRDVAFFDEPFGPARALITTDAQDGDRRVSLTDSQIRDVPVTLRVIAGGPDDDWLQVQAPTQDTTRSVWVSANDFDFGSAPRRLEIDLAGSGQLRLIDNGDIVLLVDVELSPSPSIKPQVTHVLSVTGTADAPVIAFGSGVRLASTKPDTASHIEATVDALTTLSAHAGPGTPVMVFDSSDPDASLTMVASRPLVPATTVGFNDQSPRSPFIALSPEDPTLWSSDCAGPPHVCPRVWPALDPLPVLGGTYIVATANAGEVVPGFGLRALPGGFGAWNGQVVPVSVAPGEEKRTLIYNNTVDGIDMAMPLLNPTVFDQPLLLRVLEGAPGDEWVRVQAPVRPHSQSIWVRTDGFEFGSTTKHIEIDIAGEGELRLFDGHETLLTNVIVSGRQSRPTTLHDTYVEQRIEGPNLSPAYGNWLLSLATFSDVLGTYGGGGVPGQSLHGTNQPELMGQRVSSGGIRLPDHVMAEIVADDILGARVILFDSSAPGGGLRPVRSRPFTTAATTSFLNSTLPIAGMPSYS